MLNLSIKWAIYLLTRLIVLFDGAVFRLANWREEASDEDPDASLDKAEDPDSNQITALHEFDLGDLMIECPHCGDRDHIFLVGLVMAQEDEENDDHYDLTTIGTVSYTCGCTLYSPCITDKIVTILNASDNHVLTIDMLANLTTCDEHGVLHPDE